MNSFRENLFEKISRGGQEERGGMKMLMGNKELPNVLNIVSGDVFVSSDKRHLF